MSDSQPAPAASNPVHTVQDPTRARAIARALLDIGAVELRPGDPFTWSSGLVAPIYCDNRRTLAHPSIRRTLRDGFVDVVTSHDWVPATIAGTATAGIPHAAWLAESLDQPMAYVRSAAKAHGTGRQIEGARSPGDRVVVVEDLVSTGGSALEAVAAVQGAGMEVAAVLSIFTYQLGAATAAFREAGVPLFVLCDFETLVDEAREADALTDDSHTVLHNWRADPSGWSEARGGALLD